jgi:hypothetical protein
MERRSTTWNVNRERRKKLQDSAKNQPLNPDLKRCLWNRLTVCTRNREQEGAFSVRAHGRFVDYDITAYTLYSKGNWGVSAGAKTLSGTKAIQLLRPLVPLTDALVDRYPLKASPMGSLNLSSHPLKEPSHQL